MLAGKNGKSTTAVIKGGEQNNMRKICFNMRVYRTPLDEIGFVSPMWIPYSTETDIEWAKEHSVDGEITIEDDGKPEPAPSGDDSDVWDELDAAYQEGVDSV